MYSLSDSLRVAIEKYGIVSDPVHGDIYAYETDGYGGHKRMDEVNFPALLASPFLRYLNATDAVYKNTRNFMPSSENLYFMSGPVINSTGGPHDGTSYAWPIAKIVEILTSDNNMEITGALKKILSGTDGLGLIHEVINTFNVSDWTRQWFSLANGLFRQMVLGLDEREQYLLEYSYLRRSILLSAMRED